MPQSWRNNTINNMETNNPSNISRMEQTSPENDRDKLQQVRWSIAVSWMENSLFPFWGFANECLQPNKIIKS